MRRPSGPLVVAAVLGVSCHSDSLRFLPAPPVPDWTRALLVIVEDGADREGVALELSSGLRDPIEIVRAAADRSDGVVVHVLAYPHPLERLGLSPGGLELGASGKDTPTRTVPAAARSFSATLSQGEWSAAAETPGNLLTLPLSLAPLGAEDALQAAAGEQFTCAAIGGREVRCWGTNTRGQLGFEGLAATSTPTATARSIAAIRVASGYGHTCAVERGGAVLCWGISDHGRLGRAVIGRESIPERADRIEDAVDVALGDIHSCALLASGAVRCWGDDEAGQLGVVGTPSGPLSPTPVEVPGLPLPAVELRAGARHTCARLTDGSVWCWGSGSRGELGDDRGVGHAAPAPVSGISGAVALGAGWSHACAELAGGEIRCWGDNSRGQLGPKGEPALTPVVAPIAGPGHLALSGGGSCILDDQGEVRCLGRLPWVAAADDPLLDPTRLAPAGRVRAFTCSPGTSHCCATGEDGGLWCLGWNGAGQVGVPGPPFRSTPITVPGLDDVRAAATGVGVTCALRGSSGPVCFGAVTVIPGGERVAVSPAPLSIGPGRVEELVLGGRHACARTSSAAPVLCWGDNEHAQLGDGAPSAESRGPAPVPGTEGAHGIAAGRAHTCAIGPASEVLCWGLNDDGQLGDADVAERGVVQVPGLPAEGTRQVAVGSNHTCALTRVDDVWCWGYAGTAGLLGAGTRQRRSATPVRVPGTTGAIEVACGEQHCCARLADGSVPCWGDNEAGQLGDGSNQDRTETSPMLGVDDAVGLSLGYTISCVVRRGGTVACAGLLPDGGQIRTVAEPVPEISDAVSVHAGDQHACAVTREGRLRCWGSNRLGQLGTGEPIVRSTLLRVEGLDTP